MIKFISLVAGVFLGICAFWVGAFEVSRIVGGNSQVTGLYGFTSGPGPMLLTAILGSGIFVTMWHSMNCHQAGCWNIGKHKVNGTPWCNIHHEGARHARTQEELLSEILEELKKR